MRKKLIRIAIVTMLLALVVSLFGCDGSGTAVTVKELEKDYVVDPSGKIKATTYLRSGEDSEVAFDNWIKAYNEKYPKVTVKPEIIAWSDFGVRIAAGDIGDVYYGCEANVYSYAVTNKAAMSLDAYVENLDIDISQVFTGLYDLGCANGLLYMVPSDLNPSVFYVNVSMLTEAGLECPDLTWTYDDFKEIAKQLTKTNEDGTYSQVALQLSAEFPNLLPFMNGFGGTWLDKVNKKVYFHSDENVLKGIDELIDLISKGYIYVSGITGATGAKFANISDASTICFQCGTYISRITMRETFHQLGLEMNVTCWPEFPVRTIYGGATGFFVYSKTKNPDAAATFATFLLTDEGQRAFNSTLGGGVPTTKNNYNADFWKFPEYLQEENFNFDAFTCYPEAFVGNWPEVYVPSEVSTLLYSFASTFISQHFNNVKDYKDALETLETQCNETWATIYN